jgi:hypothetical protein
LFAKTEKGCLITGDGRPRLAKSWPMINAQKLCCPQQDQLGVLILRHQKKLSVSCLT